MFVCVCVSFCVRIYPYDSLPPPFPLPFAVSTLQARLLASEAMDNLQVARKAARRLAKWRQARRQRMLESIHRLRLAHVQRKALARKQRLRDLKSKVEQWNMLLSKPQGETQSAFPPPPPINAQALATSPTSVRVTWDPPTDVVRVEKLRYEVSAVDVHSEAVFDSKAAFVTTERGYVVADLEGLEAGETCVASGVVDTRPCVHSRLFVACVFVCVCVRALQVRCVHFIGEQRRCRHRLRRGDPHNDAHGRC